jgi:hypothetical protein
MVNVFSEYPVRWERVVGDEETWVAAGDSPSSDLKGHDSGAGVAAAR